MTLELLPLRDRVLVKKDTPDEHSAGGIIIPEVCKDPPMTGTVLAIGPGKVSPRGARLPMQVQVGDHVLFPRYAGNNVMIQDEKFFLIPESEILLSYSPDELL